MPEPVFFFSRFDLLSFERSPASLEGESHFIHLYSRTYSFTRVLQLTTVHEAKTTAAQSKLLHWDGLVDLVGLFMWAQASPNISASRHPLISCGVFFFCSTALKSSGVCRGQLWTQIDLECLVSKRRSEATSQVAFSFTGLVTGWQKRRAGVFKPHEQKQETTVVEGHQSPVSPWRHATHTHTKNYCECWCIFALTVDFILYRQCKNIKTTRNHKLNNLK